MDNQNTATQTNTQPPPVYTPPVNQTPPPAPVYVVPPPQSGTPDDTRTIVTVLLLIFAYPIGFLLMWFWTRWKVWVKLLISAPGCLIFLALLGIMATGFLVAINPQAQIQKANCVKECETTSSPSACIQDCIKKNYEVTPSPAFQE